MPQDTASDPPPAYSASAQDPSHLSVPSSSSSRPSGAGGHRRTDSNASDFTTSDEGGQESVIPSEDRQTMMDEARLLPQGWRREFDPASQHYFYVDTHASPPRSIWTHPLDDPEYLSSHPKEAKELAASYAPPEGAPPGHGHGEEEKDKKGRDHVSAFEGDGKGKGTEKRSLGRKMKDKLTGSTHEQRVAERKKRQEEEMKQYQSYLRRRQEILQAQQAGRYQPAYAAPAGPYMRAQPYYGSGIGMPAYGYGGYGGYGYGGYGRRPMGGMGTGMAVGGGLLGGLLLGDMLF
ncbi:hypothetical protein JCM8097_001556 [Rhodosporidiobolus ruineniae]